MNKKAHQYAPRSQSVKINTRTLLRMEGKLVHGTKGKPTRGARGNKKF